MKLLKTISLAVLLAAGWSCANASSHFVTIQKGTSTLSNAAGWSRTFDLPGNVNLDGSIANSAVLDLEVKGSTFKHNEVFINPSSSTCKPDGPGDNTPSAGNLQEHDDDFMRNEWATNHMTFSSSSLLPGTNTLMICTRDSSGGLTGNVDNITIGSIVLHYHSQ
jgi:hypothetical protein